PKVYMQTNGMHTLVKFKYERFNPPQSTIIRINLWCYITRIIWICSAKIGHMWAKGIHIYTAADRSLIVDYLFLNAPIHILILKTNSVFSTVVIWKLSQVMRRYMHKMKEIWSWKLWGHNADIQVDRCHRVIIKIQSTLTFEMYHIHQGRG
ncbi:hypothetical protein ACJX0J_030326, partial [Zea mays]